MLKRFLLFIALFVGFQFIFFPLYLSGVCVSASFMELCLLLVCIGAWVILELLILIEDYL